MSSKWDVPAGCDFDTGAGCPGEGIKSGEGWQWFPWGGKQQWLPIVCMAECDPRCPKTKTEPHCNEQSTPPSPKKKKKVKKKKVVVVKIRRKRHKGKIKVQTVADPPDPKISGCVFDNVFWGDFNPLFGKKIVKNINIFNDNPLATIASLTQEMPENIKTGANEFYGVVLRIVQKESPVGKSAGVFPNTHDNLVGTMNSYAAYKVYVPEVQPLLTPPCKLAHKRDQKKLHPSDNKRIDRYFTYHATSSDLKPSDVGDVVKVGFEDLRNFEGPRYLGRGGERFKDLKIEVAGKSGRPCIPQTLAGQKMKRKKHKTVAEAKTPDEVEKDAKEFKEKYPPEYKGTGRLTYRWSWKFVLNEFIGPGCSSSAAHNGVTHEFTEQKLLHKIPGHEQEKGCYIDLCRGSPWCHIHNSAHRENMAMDIPVPGAEPGSAWGIGDEVCEFWESKGYAIVWRNYNHFYHVHVMWRKGDKSLGNRQDRTNDLFTEDKIINDWVEGKGDCGKA